MSIHPTFDQLISKSAFEKLLNQKASVFWLFGNSGSGKTTIASSVQKKLFESGKYVVVLDGDNLRNGLNQSLGFSDEDRMENIRRAAEVCKMFMEHGAIVLATFVCPKKEMRALANSIIGDSFYEIHIEASLDTLMERDTKGFYKKAISGGMEQLTGVNATFEIPENPSLVIQTDQINQEESIQKLLNFVLNKI
jgi:adenylylsulfate kinase